MAGQGATDSSPAGAEEAVLKTLAYFDIFHYPLTQTEIQTFLSIPVPAVLLQMALSSLLERQLIFQHEAFYSLHDNPLLVHRRTRGNEKAVPLLAKGQQIGRFLYQFPFVKAVGISGSLSKNFAGQKADIDFFIITSANRLWIARTLMHLYKKLTFLTGRQHLYCMNYYIDEEALLLEERNVFTATELKTVLPVSGEKDMQSFFAANTWADEWLPTCACRRQAAKDPGRSWIKRLVEWLLGGGIGNRIDNYLLATTTRRWKKKELRGMKNNKGVRMGLITNKHFAKSNPDDFQEKVLAFYQKQVEELLQKNSPSSFIVSSVN